VRKSLSSGCRKTCRISEQRRNTCQRFNTLSSVGFEFVTAVTMKNAVFSDIKTQVRTSKETHYVSATESSWFILFKIWGFHGCDYEECRLLGYKNPVRTSQETHYVSTTESNQLMLCKIWGFHGCDYEECLLGYKKSQFVPHRRYITSPLLSPAG
jgi:hypothetical protein